MKKFERFSLSSFYVIKKKPQEGGGKCPPPIRDRVKSITETLINFLIWIKELSLGHKLWFFNPNIFVDLRYFKLWILLDQTI